MNIVLIGCGTIGRTILEELSKEGHAITIIDEDKEKVTRLIEKFDVSGVAGNGASLDILQEANVKNADLLIATTTSDEINILACLVAEKIGAKHTIARVRSPEYYKQGAILRDELGLDLIVNPEHETAIEIANMINLPSASKIERFANGKVTLVEILVDDGSPLIGESLISIRKKLETKVLICAVQRGEEVIIPSGKFVIKKGDKINVTADTSSLNAFITELNLIKVPLKNIMIIGGNKISYYLGKEVSHKRHNLKIIEKNKDVCEELAALLPKVSVINGDGTDHDVLLEEGIESMDAFVSLTDVDEENIIVSMYAKKLNVRKAIAKVKRAGLVGIARDLGTINSVSPKNIVASKVISYVRALSNRRGSNVITLYRLVNDNVEAVEFIAKQESEIYGVPFKNLEMVDNTLVACIIRDNKVIIPDGNECIKLGDGVIIVTTHKEFEDLTDAFE
ncbi:MAG: Trk system potassium transporter TrkA [Bacilli bacterium]|nr:Trk system potassium transporter TrkA [Bacilli bacterium]